jgi:hypothetical protein
MKRKKSILSAWSNNTDQNYPYPATFAIFPLSRGALWGEPPRSSLSGKSFTTPPFSRLVKQDARIYEFGIKPIFEIMPKISWTRKKLRGKVILFINQPCEGLRCRQKLLFLLNKEEMIIIFSYLPHLLAHLKPLDQHH